MKNFCVLDTEFNAFDYEGQNDGYQEITEIGAVVMKNGKIVDRFTYLCQLYPGHQLTSRCQKITGITVDDLETGIPFRDAAYKLKRFIERNGVTRIYTYGIDDALHMRTTTKLHKLPKEIFDMIKLFRNICPIVSSQLNLPYAISLADMCRICRVDHDKPGRAHMALYDAEDTAMAYRNMMKGCIDRRLLEDIRRHKNNVGIYEKNRSVRYAVIPKLPIVDKEFLDTLDTIFRNAEKSISPAIVTALHDDMMRVIGRPDLEHGSSDL